MITCGGYGLCQWCDEDCPRHGVEAGHGSLCSQFRALRYVYSESDVIQEASKLFHSARQLEGHNMGVHEAARLARQHELSRAQANILQDCHYAVQWPASAEIATGPPRTKVRLRKDQIVMMEMSPEQGSVQFVPGKLSLCGLLHRTSKSTRVSPRSSSMRNVLFPAVKILL